MKISKIPGASDDLDGLHPNRGGSRHLSLLVDPSDKDIIYVGGKEQGTPNLGAIYFSGAIFRGNASINGTGGNPSPQVSSLIWFGFVSGDELFLIIAVH